MSAVCAVHPKHLNVAPCATVAANPKGPILHGHLIGHPPGWHRERDAPPNCTIVASAHVSHSEWGGSRGHRSACTFADDAHTASVLNRGIRFCGSGRSCMARACTCPALLYCCIVAPAHVEQSQTRNIRQWTPAPLRRCCSGALWRGHQSSAHAPVTSRGYTARPDTHAT